MKKINMKLYYITPNILIPVEKVSSEPSLVLISFANLKYNLSTQLDMKEDENFINLSRTGVANYLKCLEDKDWVVPLILS